MAGTTINSQPGVVWAETGPCGSVFAFGPKRFDDNWTEIPSGLVRFGLII